MKCRNVRQEGRLICPYYGPVHDPKDDALRCWFYLEKDSDAT